MESNHNKTVCYEINNPQPNFARLSMKPCTAGMTA